MPSRAYSIQHTIAGIGLNVNQTDFAAGLKQATSLKSQTGKEHDVKKVLDVLCEKMEFRYLQLRSARMEEIQKEYMKQLYRVEEDSIYQANDKRFHAKIMGLTAEGKIVLQVNDHHEVYGFKEVEMIF
jgi:BirA family biotin operon repressor/biotin-[acetyl-CoA-carboxylase] ligase